MKRLVAVLVGLSILMFGFQNCSQQPSPLSDDQLAGGQQSKVEDPDLKVAQSIDILTQAEDQVVNLNLSTGRLTAGSVQRCLSESMLSAINDLVRNSSLCEFKTEVTEDMMCAQVYMPAYATINWANMSVSVGEALDSCHREMDLCGQDGRTLRGLLRDVVSRFDEFSCDFQAL